MVLKKKYAVRFIPLSGNVVHFYYDSIPDAQKVVDHYIRIYPHAWNTDNLYVAEGTEGMAGEYFTPVDQSDLPTEEVDALNWF